MKLKTIIAICATFLMLFASVAMAAYQKVADNTVPAYRNAELTQRTGNERVDKGDLVTVLEERGNAYYVRYPVKNGTKDRWVPKNIFNNTGHNPEGWLDVVASNGNNQVTVKGWALDRDNVNEQIRVHIYIGGPAGSGEGHEIYARTHRPDVNQALNGVGEYHGFEATIKTNRIGNQAVYAYGINMGGGENKELSGSPKTVNIKSSLNSVTRGDTSLSGDYIILSKCNNNFALDVAGGTGSVPQQTIMQLYQRNNSFGQVLNLQRISGEWYIIKHKPTNYVMNVQYGNNASGTGLWVYPNDNTDSCLWRFIKQSDGYYKIESKLRGNPILDLAAGNVYNGAKVQLWSNHDGDAGRWKVERASAPTPFQQYQDTAKKTVPAYTNAGLSQRNGNERVDVGDRVTVLNKQGDAFYVDYPAGNSRKQRWVHKSIFEDAPAPSGKLLYPLKGRSISYSSSRTTNGQRCDYVAPSGTALYAPADGTVKFMQSYAVNYGKLASYANQILFTSSDNKYTVRCAHLNSFNGVSLKYSQSLKYPCSSSTYSCSTITLATRNVKRGELLGYTGMTGNASGPHLHIEVKENGRAVAPIDVFATW